jgi:hypothetical protein
MLRPQAARPRQLTTRPAEFSLPPLAPALTAAAIPQVDPDLLLRKLSIAPAPITVETASKVSFREILSTKINAVKARAAAFVRSHPSLLYGAAALGFGAATLLPNTALAGGLTDSISSVFTGGVGNGLLTFGLTALGAVALKAIYTRNIKRGASSIRRLVTRFFLPVAVVMNGAGLGIYMTNFLAQSDFVARHLGVQLPGYLPAIMLAGTAAIFTVLRMAWTGVKGLYNRRTAYMRAAYQEYGTGNKALTEVVSRPAQLGLLYYFSYRHTEVAAVGLGIAAKFLYNLPVLVASPLNIIFGAALGLYLGHRRAADFGRSPIYSIGVALAGGAIGAMAGALGGHLLANFFFTVTLMGFEDHGLPHSWQLNSNARKAEEHNPDDPTDKQIHETSRARTAESLLTVKCSNKAENIVSSLFVMLLCSPGANDAYVQHNTSGYGDIEGMAGLDWLRDTVLSGMKGRVTNAWRRAWRQNGPQPTWQERVEILATLCEQMGAYLRDRQSRGDFAGSGVGLYKLGDEAFCGEHQPENRHFLGKIVKYYGNLLIQDAATLRSMAADGQFPFSDQVDGHGRVVQEGKEVLGIVALKVLDTLYRKFNPPLQFSPTFNFKNFFPIPSMPDQKYHGTDMIWNLTKYFGCGTAVFRQKPTIIDLTDKAIAELVGRTGCDLVDRYFAPVPENAEKARPRASQQELTRRAESELPGEANKDTREALLALIKKGFEESVEGIPLRIAKQLRPDFNSDALWNIESRPREDNRQGWAPQPICNIGPDHASDIFMICADSQYHELVEAIRLERDPVEREKKIKALLAQFPTSDVVAAPQLPADRFRDVFFKNGSIRRIFGDGHSLVIAQSFRGPDGQAPQDPPDDISWLPGTEPNPALDFTTGNFRMIRSDNQPQIFCYLKTLLESLSDEEQTGVKVADEKCAMVNDLGPRPDGPTQLDDVEDPNHNPVLFLQRNQTVRIKAPYNPAMKLHKNDVLVRIEEGQGWFLLKVTGAGGKEHFVPLNVPKSEPKIKSKPALNIKGWEDIDRDKKVTICPSGQPGCYDVTAYSKDGTPIRFPYPELLYYLDDLVPFEPEAEIIFNDGAGPEAVWEYSHIVRDDAKRIVDKRPVQGADGKDKFEPVKDRDGRVIDQDLWDLYSRRPKRVQDYQAMTVQERAPWPMVDEEGLVHLPDGSIFTPPDAAHPCSSYLYWLQQRDRLIESTTYVGFAHAPSGFGQHFEHDSVR